MRWLKDVNDDIYDPSYTDMLRVAFTAEFGRGKLLGPRCVAFGPQLRDTAV